MADGAGEAVKIDRQEFNERVDKLLTAWRADKRSGDGLFGGASSLVIVAGKADEIVSFQKSNAIHVSWPSKSIRMRAKS